MCFGYLIATLTSLGVSVSTIGSPIAIGMVGSLVDRLSLGLTAFGTGIGLYTGSGMGRLGSHYSVIPLVCFGYLITALTSLGVSVSTIGSPIAIGMVTIYSNRTALESKGNIHHFQVIGRKQLHNSVLAICKFHTDRRSLRLNTGFDFECDLHQSTIAG